MGVFNHVDAKVEPLPVAEGDKKRRFRLVFEFKQKEWPKVKSFTVNFSRGVYGAIPDSEIKKVQKMLQARDKTTLLDLAQARNIIEGWYQKRGYVFGYIAHFDGMDKGEIVANVVEGRTNKVHVVYLDKDDKRTLGQIPEDVILAEVDFKPGKLYNSEDGRKALRDVFGMQLFDNVQIQPRQTARDETKVDVDVMVRERPMKTAEIEAEWSIAPGDNGKPTLVSMIPGGQITYENRNVGGRARTFNASINAQNLLSPQDDLGYRVEYKHPNLLGLKDPKKTTGTISAFNVRKLSGVFTAGPTGEEVPPVFVDRAGVKAAVTETYTRNSKGSLGIVFESITTRDETGAVCTQGTRQSPMGMMTMEGPPTTLSDSGEDRVVFLQANVTRDTTYFCNGTPLGARDILQVDQGLGLGSGHPVFNRHTLSATRFVPLWKPTKRTDTRLPVVAVLHGRYGASIGDMASYDYFTLGGPFSVRGFNVGELAACRRFLETAVEVRVPVLGRQAYGFWEHGTDLGSSKECRGNPTQYFRRAGAGTSWGVGVKLGQMRTEYCTDSTTGRGTVFVRFGERF